MPGDAAKIQKLRIDIDQVSATKQYKTQQDSTVKTQYMRYTGIDPEH